MKHAFIPLLINMVVTGHAQSLLTPGNTAFEKKWVSNNTNHMIWYAVTKDKNIEIGEVSTRTTLTNTRIFVITQIKLKHDTAQWIDSTIAERSTLAPIHHSSYNAQRNMVLEFGKIVTGCYCDKTKHSTTLINDTTVKPYFDSNLYPVLIGWLPLREGYQQEISIYDFNPASKGGLIKATIQNVSSGMYTTKNAGEKPVWIVSVTDEINQGKNGTTRYYFDKANRKLWKQEIDAGGRKFLMEAKE